MEKNNSSSDLENEKNAFVYDNYNLDISENDNFFHAAQCLQTIDNIHTKTVHSCIRMY